MTTTQIWPSWKSDKKKATKERNVIQNIIVALSYYEDAKKWFKLAKLQKWREE